MRPSMMIDFNRKPNGGLENTRRLSADYKINTAKLSGPSNLFAIISNDYSVLSVIGRCKSTHRCELVITSSVMTSFDQSVGLEKLWQ